MLERIRARQEEITERLKDLHPRSSEALALFREIEPLFALETQLRNGGIRGPLPLTSEEFEADLAPDAITEKLIYESSTHFISGASKGGGKSGGWRVLFADYIDCGLTFLIWAFPKGGQDSLTGAQKKIIRQIKRDIDREVKR